MELCYRGISYEYTPAAVETKVGQLAGKYRGLDWQFCNAQKAPVQQTNVELKYRGVAYGTGEAATGASATPALSAAQKARSLMMARQRAAEKRQRSLLARSNAEIGLVAVAVKF